MNSFHIKKRFICINVINNRRLKNLAEVSLQRHHHMQRRGRSMEGREDLYDGQLGMAFVGRCGALHA